MMEEAYKEGETLISRHSYSDLDEDQGGDLELSEPHDGRFPDHRGDDVTEPGTSSSRDKKPGTSVCGNCYVLSAAIMASLGGVLFGYDMGIISGAVLQLRDIFCLSCLDQELVISAMLMGAILGSLIGGFLIDHCGRRLTIIVNSVVFLVGALVMGLAPNFSVLVVGRVLVGFAVSVSATGECIYISEIAPANRRGLLVSLNELGITLGLLLAYLCNFLFISVHDGWRWMFALSAIPAVIQGVGMVFLPNSPRFLMLRRKEQQAEHVLKKLRGTSRIEAELSAIRVSIASEKNRSCMAVCGSEEGMRGRMMIGVGLVFFQQFTGQPNVLYYAPTIFENIGFNSDFAATLATVGLGVVKVLMTILALLCVDRFGRRRLLYTGALIMGISICTLGVVCHFEHDGTPSTPCVDHSNCESDIAHNHSFLPHSTSAPKVLQTTHNNQEYEKHLTQALSLTSPFPTKNNQNTKRSLRIDSVTFDVHKKPAIFNTHKSHVIRRESVEADDASEGENNSQGSLLQKILGFTALMCYVAAYGFSFGPVTWLVLSEIFPAAIKGRAIAIATVFNWGTNLIVTFTFLDIMNSLGVTGTFILFGLICIISVLFIYAFVPETKNRTLEQISVDMKNKQCPPMARMRHNCGALLCCISRGHLLRVHNNYSRVTESETVT